MEETGSDDSKPVESLLRARKASMGHKMPYNGINVISGFICKTGIDVFSALQGFYKTLGGLRRVCGASLDLHKGGRGCLPTEEGGSL